MTKSKGLVENLHFILTPCTLYPITIWCYIHGEAQSHCSTLRAINNIRYLSFVQKFILTILSWIIKDQSKSLLSTHHKVNTTHGNLPQRPLYIMTTNQQTTNMSNWRFLLEEISIFQVSAINYLGHIQPIC